MDQAIKSVRREEMKQLGKVLLKAGTMLMSAGANTGRIRNTINRIASAFDYSVELHISQRALSLTIMDEEESSFVSKLRRTPPHVINFTILSGISKMSWNIVQDNWSSEQILADLERLEKMPHYHRWMVLSLVGLAGAGFCALANGSPMDLLFTFLASFLGLFVRQEAVKANFNPYLAIYFAALTASLIAGGAVKLGLGHADSYAFVTSVLFLIPGVPLINSFSDIIDGNIQNGITRGVNALVISFSIALGIFTSTFIYQFQ